MNPENLKERARRLGLYGLLARFAEIVDEPWLERVIEIEEQERQKRSLESRIKNARFARFKTLADFDWKWPKKIDREAIDDLFSFDFLASASNISNVVIMGPNGVGKSMISLNLGYQAVLRGHTVRFVSASDMLNDLAAQGTEVSFSRRLQRYVRPTLLVIDEVGYLSYDTRHADLLFEVVTRRYEQKAIILTTNKAFAEWNEVFPNASCVVTLIDRLVHRAEIINIEGESYRLKEAKARAENKAKERTAKRKANSKQPPSSVPHTSEEP